MVDLHDAIFDHQAQTVAVLALILLTAGGASMMSSGPANGIDAIEHERRDGNVATTYLFDVRTNNGTTYRYSRKEPEAGSLCGTVSAKAPCERPVEPGYQTLTSYLNSTTVPNRTRSDRLTVYEPSRCIEHANQTHILLGSCG
jgi:hypothetical protein